MKKILVGMIVILMVAVGVFYIIKNGNDKIESPVAKIQDKTLSFESAILALTNGSDEVAFSDLKPLVGTLAGVNLNRAKTAVIDFVSNYNDHYQTRPKTLLTALYFLKYNKESNAKIIEANNFLCSSVELKANVELQGIFKQACK